MTNAVIVCLIWVGLALILAPLVGSFIGFGMGTDEES